MSTARGGFLASARGGFRESPRHARGFKALTCTDCLPGLPDQIRITLAGFGGSCSTCWGCWSNYHFEPADLSGFNRTLVLNRQGASGQPCLWRVFAPPNGAYEVSLQLVADSGFWWALAIVAGCVGPDLAPCGHQSVGVWKTDRGPCRPPNAAEFRFVPESWGLGCPHAVRGTFTFAW